MSRVCVPSSWLVEPTRGTPIQRPAVSPFTSPLSSPPLESAESSCRSECTRAPGCADAQPAQGPNVQNANKRVVSHALPCLPLSPLPARRAVLRSCVYDAMCLCKAKEPATRVAIPPPPISNQGKSDPMHSLATACQGRAAGSLTPLTVEEAQIPSPTHCHTPHLLYLGTGFIAGRA